jgi:hypothetical protein
MYFATLLTMYAFFWVIPRHLNFICHCFGTLCLFHLGLRMLGYINTTTFSNLVILHTYPPMKKEQTECFEMLAYKIQTPGNYPEESIHRLEHGESLKSRKSSNSSSSLLLCVLSPDVAAEHVSPYFDFCRSHIWISTWTSDC